MKKKESVYYKTRIAARCTLYTILYIRAKSNVSIIVVRLQSKKKWSFRSISFGRKDKSKPVREATPKNGDVAKEEPLAEVSHSHIRFISHFIYDVFNTVAPVLAFHSSRGCGESERERDI